MSARLLLQKTGVPMSRPTVRQIGYNAMKHFAQISSRLLVVTVLLALLVAGSQTARAQSLQLEESDSALIAFNEISHPCSTPMVRTLTVFDEVTISALEFDFVAAHTYRGDVQVTLVSPAGTQVLAVYSFGDPNDNFNIRLADSAVNLINNGGNDNPDLPTRRLVKPANPLSAFNGQNAQGLWRVMICD